MDSSGLCRYLAELGLKPTGAWRRAGSVIGCAPRPQLVQTLHRTLMASPSPSSSSQPNNANNGPVSIIKALGQAFKSQTGDNLSGDKIATLLLQNMPQLSELAKQGKLNQQQIQQASPPVVPVRGR